MGTFFVALKRNDSDDERVRPTWDEIDRRIGYWSRPSEGGVIGVSGVDDADGIDVSDQSDWHRKIGERSSPGMKFLTLGRDG
jgi:hypothetical protein